MQQLTTNELKEKINNRENFILDLYATWCGPCKMMLFNLDKLEEHLSKESGNTPKYGIYKFDIDSDREFIMSEMGIRSVPTIKIFKEGKEVFTKAGVMSTLEVLNLLQN